MALRMRPTLLGCALTVCLAACDGGAGRGVLAESGPLSQADRALTLNDVPRARTILEGLLVQDPDAFAPRYRLGALGVDDAPRDAIANLEAAAALEPAHPGPPGFTALARYRLSDFQGAERALRMAWDLARTRAGLSLPDTSEALRRGIEELHGERFVAAVDAFAEVLAADSSQAAVWVLSGRALRRGGALDRAERAAARALDLSPDLPAARVLRASVWTAQGKLAEARAELEALIEGHPDLAEAHYELGLAHRKNNDYRAAALAFWRAALADPTETEHHQALGQILLRMGAPEAGTNALQHAEWVRGFFDRRFGRGSFRRPR